MHPKRLCLCLCICYSSLTLYIKDKDFLHTRLQQLLHTGTDVKQKKETHMQGQVQRTWPILRENFCQLLTLMISLKYTVTNHSLSLSLSHQNLFNASLSHPQLSFSSETPSKEPLPHAQVADPTDHVSTVPSPQPTWRPSLDKVLSFNLQKIKSNSKANEVYLYLKMKNCPRT